RLILKIKSGTKTMRVSRSQRPPSLKPALSRSRLEAASAAPTTFSRIRFYRLLAGSFLIMKPPERRPPESVDLPARAEPTSPTQPSAPVSRVRQALITSENEQPISRAEALKGYEVEPDRYVVFEQEELRRSQRKTSPDMAIVRSVALAEIDPVF